MRPLPLVPVIAALAPLPALAAAPECPELTGLQVAAGFVTWLNVMKFFAAVIGVASILILFRNWIALLVLAFAAIPAVAYEALGYVVAVALVASAPWWDPTLQFWPIFGGSLLLGGLIVLTASLHAKGDDPTGLFAILFAVWAAIAVAYLDESVGFLAVIAFMGMLGFSAAVIPMGYVVGFARNSIAKATGAAFLVTLAASGWHVAGIQMANPFQWGALWMGPVVLFLGLLIMASRYHASEVSYAVRQVAPLVLGVAGMFAGATYGIPHLVGIAGTFLVLYLVEKAADIPARSLVDYAVVGVLVSAILGVAIWWAQNHMDLVGPYLLF